MGLGEVGSINDLNKTQTSLIIFLLLLLLLLHQNFPNNITELYHPNC